MTDLGPRPCRKCGMTIRFFKNQATGNTLPLQQLRTIYKTRQGPGGELVAEKIPLAEKEVYVSHFETCPQARHFNRSKKR